MQIFLPPAATYVNEQLLYVEHNGQVIPWSTAAFSKRNFTEDRDLFKHINEYWASLSAQRQEEIFTIYIKINEVFDTTDLDSEIDHALNKLLFKLMLHHNFAEIKKWAQIYSGIVFPGPPHLLTEYKETIDKQDRNYTRDKTYIVSDYVDLVCMILQLRVMIPIWGRYIGRTHKLAGTVFKEYYALKLLDRTVFMTEEPIKKLYDYIETVLPVDGSKAHILMGVSSEEFAYWNMAQLVVRKLCLSDIRGLDPTPVLIRHISKYLMEKVKRLNSGNNTKIKDKNNKSSVFSSGSEEDQVSLMEQYKIKQDISTGDIQLLIHYASDPVYIARTIYPQTSDVVISKMVDASRAILKTRPEDAQTLLLSWLLDPAVPAEAVGYLNSSQRALALGAVAAAYWDKGHKLMSALCTATVVSDDDGADISSTGSKGRLSKETTEQLEKLFPYPRQTKRGKVVRDELLALDEIVELFVRRSWVLNIHNEYMKELQPTYPELRRLTIPHDFKEQMARLIIDAVQVPRVDTLSTLIK